MDTKVLIRPKSNINHQSNCSSCNQRGICMPADISKSLLKNLDELVTVRKLIKAGETLYHAGSRFQGLYAIKSGSIKIENHHYDGRVQINGFYMMGEIFGFDGIAMMEYLCTSIAIEDSEICLIPFERIENMDQEFERLKRHFYELMSGEIERSHGMMLLLGNMQAEERLAVFLLDLSQRYQDRGYSPNDFMLRMTRGEIGNYLGMQIETVSRIFSKFQEQGLLKVHLRNVEILDLHLFRILFNKRYCK